MFKVLILIALIACVALAAKKEDKLIRFDLKKIPDREFVAGILARAAKGIKPSYKLKGSGSIVINDYENSQYYGEISLGIPSLTHSPTHLTHSPYSLTHSPTHLTHSLTHLLTQLLTHSPTYLLL